MTNDQRAIIEALPGWASPAKIDYVCKWIREHKASLVVELGVYGGRLLLPMALAAQEFGGRTIGVDPWSVDACLEGMKSKENIEWWSKNAALELVYEGCGIAADKLGLIDGAETLMLVRKTSDDALPIIKAALQFSDNAGIDCLSIDGNHSAEPAMRDFKNYVPLVRSGGLVVADDEGWTEGGVLTVKPAIDWACSDGGCEYICSVDGAAMLRKK